MSQAAEILRLLEEKRSIFSGTVREIRLNLSDRGRVTNNFRSSAQLSLEKRDPGCADPSITTQQFP